MTEKKFHFSGWSGHAFKHRGVRKSLCVFLLVVIIGLLPGFGGVSAQTSSNTNTYDTGNWVINSDGTLGLNDDAVTNAVRNITGDVSLVLIGTEGRTITLPTTIFGVIATKISNEKDAALVLYKGNNSGQKVK
ncbi:MAG: hypothetical protein IJG85_04075 [Eubacteriaceae bacterium]|nr:hypothetical protein [Eubacteriaceae bacterium]